MVHSRVVYAKSSSKIQDVHVAIIPFVSSIKQWIEQDNKSCPTCGKPVSLNDLKKPSKAIRKNLNQPNVKCAQCGDMEIKRRDFDNHIVRRCPKTTVICPAASVKCLWKGYRNELDVHLATCPYNMLQPTLENFMLQNEQLAKQVIQYKSRIKKLESEALEMNKNIMGLEELCKDYKDQIEQLTNQGPCE
jgi:hypothetical protein